jgi:MFS family permease
MLLVSLMRDERPAGRLGGAIALMRASLCVGGALGLSIAALVADSFDWHVLFRVAAVPAPALVLVLTIVPDSGVRAGAAAAFAALADAAFLPTHRVAAVRRGAAV